MIIIVDNLILKILYDFSQKHVWFCHKGNTVIEII